MPSYSTGAPGVPSSYKLPKVMIALLLGASLASSLGSARTLLLIGNKTSAGTLTADAAVGSPTGPDDAVVLAGVGSELALGAAAAYASEPGISLKLIACAESAGTNATGTITCANAATGTGEVRVWIHGVRIACGITTGSVIATTTGITQTLTNAINA